MAVVALVVVAVAGVVGVPVVLARRRPTVAPATASVVWTATTRPPPWLVSAHGTPSSEPVAPPDDPPATTPSPPGPPPADPTPAVTPAPAPSRAEPAHDAPPPPPGPCDWELRLAAGGQQVVLRRARGRPCCVHTLTLAWQDWPPGTERDDQGLTWSGESTRTDASGASSRTRRARTTRRATPRGPGLTAGATIVRESGPEITTSWDEASDDTPRRAAGTERLWTAHTRTLRAAGARSRPDDLTVAATLDVVDRLRVRVDVERGCPTGGHRLAARARAGVEVTGTVRGAADARCRVPAVAAWTDGDLDVAATSPVSAAPGTTVLPLGRDTVTPVPSIHDRSVAVEGDPLGAGVAASLVGSTDTTVGNGGLDLRLGSMALLDLALGAVDRSAAEARVDVVLHHRLAVLVAPREDAGCACRPSWALQLGGEVLAEPSSSPLGRLVIGDAELVLHRATGVGPPGAVWAVPAAS